MEQFKQVVQIELTKCFHQIGNHGKLAMMLDPRTKNLKVFGPSFQNECETLLKRWNFNKEIIIFILDMYMKRGKN